VVLAGAVTAWLSPGLDEYCFALAAVLYEWLWPGLVACADVAALWRVAPPGWWFALALPASLVCLCRWHWALRLTAACAVLPLVFAPSRAPPAGSAVVRVLDVGSGSLVLIHTAGHVLMFDTGDGWNTRGSRLMEQAMPALDAAGILGVDRLMLPALNADRAHAAALLAHERGVRQLWVGGGWPGSGLPVSTCSDARWDWDGVHMASYAIGRYCLLRVTVQGFSLLLAGDLDAGAERRLLARLAPGELSSNVVLIGRQVAEAGSSTEWIENTAPGLAIASGGIEHASSRQRVIERWRRAGSRILDTRHDGGIELEMSSRGIETRTVVDSRYPFPWRRVSAALQRPPV
jgi:competence protein ComEC